MGDVSVSYRDKLVSHLVNDESCRGGDEAGYYDLEATASGKETEKILVSDSYGEYQPGDDDGADLSGTELR